MRALVLSLITGAMLTVMGITVADQIAAACRAEPTSCPAAR